MRKTQFTEGEYYHVYNRGADKRTVFMDQRDYERFTYLLFACNDTKPLLNSQFYYRGFASIEKYPREREQLVDIVCFCLMPNHFHLLLRPRIDTGVSLFMQKLGTGYTMYFNTRHKRNGNLFQGLFKDVHIDREEYLTHVTRYIHLNPAEMQEPRWKEEGIKDWNKTHEFVKNYPWSSYSDYLDGNRFFKIINRGLITELYDSPRQYEQFVKEWLVKDLDLLSGYTIEVSPL